MRDCQSKVESNPAMTDVKEPTNLLLTDFCCCQYRIKKKKRNDKNEPKFCTYHGRSSVTLESGLAEFNCTKKS